MINKLRKKVLYGNAMQMHRDFIAAGTLDHYARAIDRVL